MLLCEARHLEDKGETRLHTHTRTTMTVNRSGRLSPVA